MRSLELSQIYRTAPIGLAVLDLQFRFVAINERLAEINGLPVEAHIGRTVREILPLLADQAEAVLERVRTTREPIQDLEIVGETPAKPGVKRVWREQFNPLVDEKGALIGISVVAEEITDRKAADAALQQSEEQLSLAMEASGLGFWDWDLQSGHLVFGRGWSESSGQPVMPSEPTYEAWLKLIHPEDLGKVKRCLEEHVEGRSPTYRCEYRFLATDGGWRWINSRGRVSARDESGRALRMLGVRRDVSAEKAAREHLAQQAKLLQLAFDAIFVWSPENGIEEWNRGAVLQYGYAEEEAIGRDPHELLATVFESSWDAKSVESVLAAQGLWTGELSHQTKDGRRVAVDAVMQQVIDGGGRILEITRDITAMKAYQNELERSQQELLRARTRLDVAMASGQLGVWEWQAGEDALFWSPTTFSLLGLAPSDASGSMATLRGLLHPDDEPRLDGEIARVLAGADDFEVEFRIRRPDGEERWLLARARRMAEDGKNKLVGIVFDITERRQGEEALRESDTKRTEFLAMLAHELRNPLAPIVNAVLLLERVGEDAASRSLATQILKRQSAHLARLVDDLLEASRVTQGRIELRIEEVALSGPIMQAIEAARPLLVQRGQSLTLDVPADLEAAVDPARLTQIVSNLITNATKYTPDGGAITVSAREREGRWGEITVSDTGAGLSRELQPHVFELFTQDRRTLDRAQGGLGIGLALVKRLTELHGGTVECSSPGPNLGSTFTVRVPLLGRRRERRPVDDVVIPAGLEPMDFLVVDDNEDAARTLASLLILDGHRVETCFNGRTALERFDALRPAVILLDIGLPEIDGLTVARRIRTSSDHGNVILIAMSGYAQAADRQAALTAGFDAHLAKPVNLARIYATIAAVRSEPRQRAVPSSRTLHATSINRRSMNA